MSGLWLLCGLWFLIANISNNSALAKNFTPRPFLLAETEKVNNGAKSMCSEQDLETLTTQLLQDLPSYANRANQRARRRSRSADLYSYMLVAGRPEFTALPLNIEEYSTGTSETSASGVEQVFFTTLERQYINKTAIELQEFHWLLLTKTISGWRLVMMFSQTGAYPKNQPPSPPRDSSNGAIAQGVQAWLRDCQAGSVRK
ncbi:MAG: hypothetical protein RMX96_08425 [Nostoc sp. ChiSLP02]|nr:hypothetical protein [Nostoc sp. DedSLP05]MDZ8102543.1 hypothetical protein [Nostoc sp. DedSLP01]MDZ8184862.1 hypothetical protein [Nostoc sp. ChiSLP02]